METLAQFPQLLSRDFNWIRNISQPISSGLKDSQKESAVRKVVNTGANSQIEIDGDYLVDFLLADQGIFLQIYCKGIAMNSKFFYRGSTLRTVLRESGVHIDKIKSIHLGNSSLGPNDLDCSINSFGESGIIWVE